MPSDEEAVESKRFGPMARAVKIIAGRGLLLGVTEMVGVGVLEGELVGELLGLGAGGVE